MHLLLHRNQFVGFLNTGSPSEKLIKPGGISGRNGQEAAPHTGITPHSHSSMPVTWSSEQFVDKLLQRNMVMNGDIGKNPVESSYPQRFMPGYCNFMSLSGKAAGEALMTPRLAHFPIFVPGKETGEFIAIDISRELHARITSSRTICSLITRGRSSFVKWHETASLIMLFSSSNESASVKIEWPSECASYPPSGDSSTIKMISLFEYCIRNRSTCNYAADLINPLPYVQEPAGRDTGWKCMVPFRVPSWI